MHSRHTAILLMPILVALLAALPGFVYVIGLASIDGRPVPADPARLDHEAVATAWAQCREQPPVEVEAMNPWGVAGNLLFGNPLARKPGQRSASRIAINHNAASPAGSNLGWHIAGAALSVWITRHWSAEQIGATLVRDNVCA